MASLYTILVWKKIRKNSNLWRPLKHKLFRGQKKKTVLSGSKRLLKNTDCVFLKLKKNRWILLKTLKKIPDVSKAVFPETAQDFSDLRLHSCCSWGKPS